MSPTGLARLNALAMIFAVPVIYAAESSYPCESETSRLMNMESSWEALYADGMALPPKCFDGYFAEGISDTLARKMVADWQGFKSLIAKNKDEEKFFLIILRSINSTLDANDIKALAALAKTSCNPLLEKQCKAIAKEAADALSELQ